MQMISRNKVLAFFVLTLLWMNWFLLHLYPDLKWNRYKSILKVLGSTILVIKLPWIPWQAWTWSGSARCGRAVFLLLKWDEHRRIQMKKSKFPPPDSRWQQMMANDSRWMANASVIQSNPNPNPESRIRIQSMCVWRARGRIGALMLRLKDGKEYPAVDVMRELRTMKAWAASARRAENLYIFGKSRTTLTRIAPYWARVLCAILCSESIRSRQWRSWKN